MTHASSANILQVPKYTSLSSTKARSFKRTDSPRNYPINLPTLDVEKSMIGLAGSSVKRAEFCVTPSGERPPIQRLSSVREPDNFSIDDMTPATLRSRNMKGEASISEKKQPKNEPPPVTPVTYKRRPSRPLINHKRYAFLQTDFSVLEQYRKKTIDVEDSDSDGQEEEFTFSDPMSGYSEFKERALRYDEGCENESFNLLALELERLEATTYLSECRDLQKKVDGRATVSEPGSKLVQGDSLQTIHLSDSDAEDEPERNVELTRDFRNETSMGKNIAAKSEISKRQELTHSSSADSKLGKSTTAKSEISIRQELTHNSSADSKLGRNMAAKSEISRRQVYSTASVESAREEMLVEQVLEKMNSSRSSYFSSARTKSSSVSGLPSIKVPAKSAPAKSVARKGKTPRGPKRKQKTRAKNSKKLHLL
ncbi:MAG: hypothetical protein SGCHY_002967 [Lobulomycetales sp.]